MKVIYRKGYDPDMTMDLKRMIPFKIVHELEGAGVGEFWVTNIYEEGDTLVLQCPENY